MNLELNNNTYNERALSVFQNLLLSIRAWFYEKEIIQSIFDSQKGCKSEGYNIDMGGGGGHKTKKIYTELIAKSGNLTMIEPSHGMRRIAKERLKHTNIHIEEGDTNSLGRDSKIENIYCNQVTHHLTDFDKKNFFKNAYKSLKEGGRLYILDTTVPPQTSILPFIVFKVSRELYKIYIGKGNNYYNIKTQEYIDMLEEVGFYVDQEYSRHFYILKSFGEWCTKKGIMYPFMTQIVAIKK